MGYELARLVGFSKIPASAKSQRSTIETVPVGPRVSLWAISDHRQILGDQTARRSRRPRKTDTGTSSGNICEKTVQEYQMVYRIWHAYFSLP